MTTLRNHAIAAECAIDPRPAPAARTALTARARAMFDRLHAAGRRGASLAACGHALATYWTFVREAPSAERWSVLDELQRAVADGATTSRVWLPIALGDPQFELAHAAARHYLGGWPASVERREQGVADVTDWIVRSLGLNRPALLFALLEQADGDALERHGALRGRLTSAEARVVLAACERGGGDALVEFATQWRAELDASVSSTPSPEPRAA